MRDPFPLPATIAISGASGMVGTALRAHLERRGTRVLRLVRRPEAGPDDVSWSPRERRLDPNQLAPAGAVVHLAGENLGSGRWTQAKKRRILESRVAGTRLVAEALTAAQGPTILISASAYGYYGDRGDEILTEESAPGEGFLPQVAVAWEAAASSAERAGVRVVRLRFGIVLSRSGGMLARVLPFFRLGLGGMLGDGRQWMSWITLGDVVRVIEAALGDPRYDGPFNVTAPRPVTNREFTRALGTVLGRPTLLAVPPFALRLALGDMADEALLTSIRAVPARLEKLGFSFETPALEPALRALVQG